MVGVGERREDFEDGKLIPVLDEGSVYIEERLEFVKLNLVDNMATEEGKYRGPAVLGPSKRKGVGGWGSSLTLFAYNIA